MAEALTLIVTPRPLDSGTAEERATFGMLEVRANGRCLTEGVASHACHELLPGPYVSGYHLAEWLVWHWWRLRWESPPTGEPGREWAFAHCLSYVGEGYVWPNIVVSSDGFRAVVASAPAIDAAAALYRYVGAPGFEVIPVEGLETAIGNLVRSMLERLEGAGLRDTNLHRLWRAVSTESENADAAHLRKVEARLGHDPDEMSEDEALALDVAKGLGDNAVLELAAESGSQGHVRPLPSREELADSARRDGFDATAQDGVSLHTVSHIPAWGSTVAWRVGVVAAQALRRQEALNGEVIDNRRLAELAGTTPAALERVERRTQRLSFMLSEGGRTRLALRSRWEVGRRFDLARLLGDRLLAASEPLLLATGAGTYRQKAQRAFAAELLCPYEAVTDLLAGDRSEEGCEEAAMHFNVSSWAISALLANNEGHMRGTAYAQALPVTGISAAVW